ncbi:Uncharacterised protein [Mycobacteroides abscessus subsp. abscessus]|nr:Uncharacterised protein [Mycobacteroides abscessus subsp. abscessus]
MEMGSVAIRSAPPNAVAVASFRLKGTAPRDGRWTEFFIASPFLWWPILQSAGRLYTVASSYCYGIVACYVKNGRRELQGEGSK